MPLDCTVKRGKETQSKHFHCLLLHANGGVMHSELWMLYWPRCSPETSHCTGHRWWPAQPSRRTARTSRMSRSLCWREKWEKLVFQKKHGSRLCYYFLIFLHFSFRGVLWAWNVKLSKADAITFNFINDEHLQWNGIKYCFHISFKIINFIQLISFEKKITFHSFLHEKRKENKTPYLWIWIWTDLGYTHLVGGERACLVWANNWGAAKSLHRGKASDDGILLGHTTGSQCQTSGYNSRQACDGKGRVGTELHQAPRTELLTKRALSLRTTHQKTPNYSKPTFKEVKMVAPPTKCLICW